MGFNDNKSDLLNRLQSANKDKQRQKLNAAARNRLHEKAIGATASSFHKKEESLKLNIIIFGKQRLFTGNLKGSLSAYYNVIDYSDIDKATDYLMDNNPNVIIMDMDPPTDWKECHDLFTTGKMMHPELIYIMYQSNKTPSDEVLVLEKKGAIVMNKPLDRAELIAKVKELSTGEDSGK